MKFAYPQNPSAAVSTVRRFDEASDALTQQSDLDRKQSVALIGETVPMVFCNRSDFGNGQGENGGVWVSPKLVQLGLQDSRLSMMYLLSQGKISGLEKENVFWGQQKLDAADDTSQFCHAYEAVPGCLDLDYKPGESLGWTQTYISAGPEGGTGSFTTEPDCIKINVTWQSEITVKGSGSVVGGYDGIAGSYEIKSVGSNCKLNYRVVYPIRGEVGNGIFNVFPEFDERSYFEITQPWTAGHKHFDDVNPAVFPYWSNVYGPWRDLATTSYVVRPSEEGANCPQPRFTNFKWDYDDMLDPNDNSKPYLRPPEGVPNGMDPFYTLNERWWFWFDMRKHHLQTSWDQTSEIRYTYEVIDLQSGNIVATDDVWVKHGTTSLTIEGLEPSQYQVRFFDTYKERDKPVGQVVIPDPEGDASIFWYWYIKDNYPTEGPPSDFVRWTNPGAETVNISSMVTQTIYQELDFPDLPGGQPEFTGGLTDLTMAGIEGSILNLRPIGIYQFHQAHIFVERGIEVNRLLDGSTGSSRYYPDLVNYLMGETKILQNDQIDIDSLTIAARMNEAYSLFFNGILQTTNSLAEWVTRTAPYFLLSARQVDGKYGLMPVCPLDGNYQLKQTRIDPSFVITADQIVQGSYRRSYISNKDRKPTCLVMVYRDQPSASIGQTVTIEARYPGTALSGPFEQHDLTEFCCRGEHAVYAARYILAKRRHTTHTCSLTMGREGRAIKPGDIVRVDLDLDTTDGKGIADQTMYQVESLTEGQQGSVRLELMHFPVNENGESLVAKEVHGGAISIS